MTTKKLKKSFLPIISNYLQLFRSLLYVSILAIGSSVIASEVMSAKPSSKKAIVLEEYVFLKGPTRDCHASSLLELTNGDLLCTWFGGTR